MTLTKKLNFGRMLWTLFVAWYFIIFSRNFFPSLLQERTSIPIIFFIILVLWMAIEYYFVSPLWQSGIVQFHSITKLLFSLLFYGVTVYCIADYATLHKTQIGFAYPYLNIAGIVIFFIGVFIRLLTLFELLNLPVNKLPKSGSFNVCRHPRYLATLLQIIAIPLVFTSYLGLFINIIIGLVIIYRHIHLEEQLLIKQYKDEYIQYRNNVPFIIPKFSRLSSAQLKDNKDQNKKK